VSEDEITNRIERSAQCPIPSSQSRNGIGMKWIAKLWRGEFDLGKAFWVFGILIPVLWYFVSKFLIAALLVVMLAFGLSGSSASNGPLAASLFVLAAMVVITLAYQVLAGVGIWRSARKFEGDTAYAFLARGVIVLYFAYFVWGISAAVRIWLTTHRT
jgi:hypothetical protein